MCAYMPADISLLNPLLHCTRSVCSHPLILCRTVVPCQGLAQYHL